MQYRSKVIHAAILNPFFSGRLVAGSSEILPVCHVRMKAERSHALLLGGPVLAFGIIGSQEGGSEQQDGTSLPCGSFGYVIVSQKDDYEPRCT